MEAVDGGGAQLAGVLLRAAARSDGLVADGAPERASEVDAEAGVALALGPERRWYAVEEAARHPEEDLRSAVLVGGRVDVPVLVEGSEPR